MAKPVTLPLWATDTTNTTTGSVEVGQTVKLEPSTGVKQQGWIAGEEAPARWMNWLLNNIYTWAVYLDGLATDAQFLSTAFAFTGNSTHAGDETFNGANTHNGSETFNNSTLLGGAIELSYAPARTRVVMVSLDAVAQLGNLPGFTGGGVTLQSQSTTDVVAIPLHLPRGAIITQVRFGFVNGNASAATVGHGLYRTVPNKTTPNASSTTVLWSTSPSISGGGTNLVSSSGAISVTVDNTASNYYLQVASTQAQTYVAWAEVTYTDPGPRNG